MSSPKSARVSLTDRCDLACVYCRSGRNDGYLEHRLEEGAWRGMVRGLVAAGVERIRLTGGEPLLDPHVLDRVRYLVSVGVKDVALTTNATQLARLAASLKQAGLRRITVSLDSLDPVRFRRITRGGDLASVLAGIEAARAAEFEELKINCVVLRGENEDELPRLTTWSWERGITPRFIEVMAIGEGAKIVQTAFVSAQEMKRSLEHLLVDEQATVDPHRGPAKYLRARQDPSLRVGFITGTSDTFCESCDRLRVSAEGTLRPCLATEVGVNVASAARDGLEKDVAEGVRRAWDLKPDGRSWKGCTEETAAHVSMRAIGG